MFGWMMPASEAKVISDSNDAIKRTLDLFSTLILERARLGHTFAFISLGHDRYNLLRNITEEDFKAVEDILFDNGYIMLPFFERDSNGVELRTRKTGFNIDWSGQYD